MKTLTAVLTVVVAMCISAPALAQAPAQRERERLGERLQDLNLTDEQEAKIADIRKECRPEVQKAAKELAAVAREELDKIRKVLTPEQQQKLRAFAEERREHRLEGLCERVAHLRELDLTDAEVAKIQEIRKELRPKIEKAMEGLRGTLTAEQRQARDEALKAGKRRKEVLAAMKLTDEQKQKAQAVGKEVAALVREELGQMRDVLTAEQKEKLAELKDERHDRVRDRLAHRIANAKELNLTEEQKAQIQEVRKEYRPKVHEAGNKFRAAVRDEATQILAVIKG
jgi:Spy/CpxP family protein refolding chaperone